MLPTRLLGLPMAALLFLCLLAARTAHANPIKITTTNTSSQSTATSSSLTIKREIGTTSKLTSTAPSAQKMTANSSSSTRKTATATSSFSETTSVAPFPTDDARIAIASSSTGPTSTFCRVFISQCFKTALKGQSGEVRVSYACRRVGRKHSLNYIYTCSRNGIKITDQVLEDLGEDYDTPSTTTLLETRVLTKVIQETTTSYDRSTRTTRLIDATTTSTAWTRLDYTILKTIPSTVSSTTIIPYTISTTATKTATEITTSLTTTTATETEAFIGTGEIPIYEVSLSEEELQNAGLVRRGGESAFCSAYKAACESECARVFSTVKISVCYTHRSPKYTMGCVCKNNKRETQHALEAVAEDRKLVSVTILDTATRYTTATRTAIRPTEVLVTQLVTLTSVVDSTSTVFSTSTLTLGETTRFTGRSSMVRETTSVTPSTTTTSVTRTISIEETTRLVLTQTGYIHGFDIDSGLELGTIARKAPRQDVCLLPPGMEDVSYINFMAVRDSPTGLYKLSDLEDPTISVIFRGTRPKIPFSSGTNLSVTAIYADPTTCGPSGVAPGPVAPVGLPCEAFVISPLAFDPSPGAVADTALLRPFWVNNLGMTPSNHSGTWAYWPYGGEGDNFVLHVADKDVFAIDFPSVRTKFFTLRFPFTS